jgi:carboxypeptidase C (cathepsin A)
MNVGLILLACFQVLYAAPAADEITSLPGWTGALPSRQYSGYLDISSTKHLHYWFVQSEKNPASDPVVLWLNGGPGCSSLDGFFYEHGPFEIDVSNYSKLLQRDYRWNLVANTLYLESPVGVGFSYSSNPSVDYKCTDDTTANDNLLAVEAFFAKFPEYINNKFFITGESYAGIYVPTLAEAILNAATKGTYKGAPLQGIAVGNGCSGDQIGICGWGTQGTYYEWEYLLQLGFLSDDTKAQINANCNWTAAKANDPNAITAKCQNLLDQAGTIIGHVDLYNVYGDCVSSYDDLDAESGTKTLKAPHNSFLRLGSGGPDACIDSRAATGYLNNQAVWTAIHVQNPGFTWGVCTTAKGWSYTSTRPNLPRDTYPALINNYRVVIYNGDWDACVPYTDNQAWTENMGFAVNKSWHAWLYTSESGATNQVAGYAVKYTTTGKAGTGFQFITVRGGRHEVPETAPGKALEMLNRIIAGTDF